MEHPREDDGLRELTRKLEELHDAQADDHVRDLIWQLISDVETYRRNQNEGTARST